MRILGIESSCDDTAAAVVADGKTVLSSVTASQISSHIVFGGVVPEIASRMHVEAISDTVREALFRAEMNINALDAIAVTYAPGLIGSLLLGVNYAKGLAYAAKKPLIPVHHMRGHIAANFLLKPAPKPPFLCLTVSGGHTLLVMVRDYTEFTVLGTTRDDAAGECLDKVARVMGLPYPGGIHLERLAQNGNPKTYRFAKPKVTGSKLDFSFSGLKSDGLRQFRLANQHEDFLAADFAASFQDAVTAYLCKNTILALYESGAAALALAGGVSANTALRTKLSAACKEARIPIYLPELRYCGDNGAMIAAQGYYEYQAGHAATMQLNARASAGIMEELA
jgi:N6-L-threonylcarbamoyladenine synthase